MASFALLLNVSVSAQKMPDFRYQLDWAETQIDVALSYKPAKRHPDTVVLYYGNRFWGGQYDIFTCVKNLRVSGAHIAADSANMLVKVFDISSNQVEIRYSVRQSLPDSNLNCPKEMFRPNISSNSIYCHGINLFLRPAQEQVDCEKSSVSVVWGQKPTEHQTGSVHAFKELMMAAKKHASDMTPEQFIRICSRFVDQRQLQEDFDRYILRGETMLLDDSQLPSGCVQRHKADGTPYLEISDETAFAKHFQD